jgi:hypothetical protein
MEKVGLENNNQQIWTPFLEKKAWQGSYYLTKHRSHKEIK